jgi:hypothetical protein
MSILKDSLKRLYPKKVSLEQLKNMLENKTINENDYQEIINK